MNRWIVISVILVIGIGLSYSIKSSFESAAYQAWVDEAETEAESLTNSLLVSIESNYSPIVALGVLAEASSALDAFEFQNAVDSLVSKQKDIFLEDIAIYGLQIQTSDFPVLKIEHYSEINNLFSAEIPDGEELKKAFINSVMERYGDVIIHPPISKGRGYFFPVTFSIDAPSGSKVLVGAIDYIALLSSFNEVYVPEGVSLDLSGQFLNSDRIIDVISSDPIDGLLVPTKVVSASAEFTITWQFDAEYSDGVDNELAFVVFESGLLLTFFLAIFTHFLLMRNRTISLKVSEAIADLRQKESQLFKAKEKAEASATIILEKERQLRNILDLSPIGFCITTAGKVVYHNSRLKEMMGVENGEPISKYYKNPNQRRLWSEQLATECVIKDFELQVTGRNNETLDALSTFSQIDFDGNSSWLGWFYDITPLKQLTGELSKEKDKAEHVADELQDKLGELEEFNKMAVGRELKMIELKEEVNFLLCKLGQKPRYDVVE